MKNKFSLTILAATCFVALIDATARGDTNRFHNEILKVSFELPASANPT